LISIMILRHISIGQTLHEKCYHILIRDEDAEVSLTVDPARRGEGQAVRILRALADAAAGQGVQRLTAEVKHTNVPSLRAFQAAGFERESGGEIVRFTLALAARQPARGGAGRS